MSIEQANGEIERHRSMGYPIHGRAVHLLLLQHDSGITESLQQLNTSVLSNPIIRRFADEIIK